MKKPRARSPNLDKNAQRNVALHIIQHQHDKSLKQVAYDLGIPYATVYRIFRELVNVSKTFTLRD